MLCRNAMVTDVISASPDQTNRDALRLFEKCRVRALPIVDAAGKLLGLFTFEGMLSKLLPAALTVDKHELNLMDAHLRLDYVVNSTPDVAKHLRDLLPVALGEVMNRKVQVTHPDTALWEGIRFLVQHGSPIPVVEEESGKLLGLLSVQRVTARLMEVVGEQR